MPEHGHDVLAVDVHLVQAVPGGAGAARDGGAFLERELVGQVYEGAGRADHVVGVGAVAGAAAEGYVADGAELLVAHGADFADAAALVVVAHDAVAEVQAGRSTGAELLDDTAGLVAGDHFGRLGIAVTVQVGAAQSGGANPQHGLARPGVGVWELA